MIVKKLKCRSNSGRPHPRPLSRLRKRGVASLVLVLLAATAPAVRAAEPIDIGSRRELFVDRFLIQRLTGATLELHRPTYAGIVLRRQFPWEGTFAFGYVTVIKDGDRYRMYYRTYPGGETADGGTKEMTCYAESTDGIHWIRPELGLFDVLGTKKNNAVLAGMAPYTHNFTPLLDARPGVPAQERYKALGEFGQTAWWPSSRPTDCTGRNCKRNRCSSMRAGPSIRRTWPSGPRARSATSAISASCPRASGRSPGPRRPISCTGRPRSP